MSDFSLDATVLKVDRSLGLVMGWGIVCKDAGQDYWDRQGDHVPEDAMLQAAADFMAGGRMHKEMHSGDARGTVVFAWPMTTDVAKAFGVETEKTGLMVAVKPDPELLSKFESGELTGFSIGGKRQEDQLVESGEVTKYSENQARDDHGRFGGGGASGPRVPADVHRMQSEHDQNAKRIAEIKGGKEASRLQHETRRLEGRNSELRTLMARVQRNALGRPEVTKYSEDQARDEGGRFTAGQLNEHLKSGGVVQVTTSTKSTLYGQRHAGMFSEKNGNLHVKHGKGTNQLSQGDRLLVGIRTGRYVQKSAEDEDDGIVLKYSADQERDDHGRFGSGGGPNGGGGKASLREQKLFTRAHENLRDLRSGMLKESDPQRRQAMQDRAGRIHSYIRHQLESRPGIEAHFVASEQKAGHMHKGLGDDPKSGGKKPSDMVDLEGAGDAEPDTVGDKPEDGKAAQEKDRKKGKVVA